MGCCRPSVPRRFLPGRRGFPLCSWLWGRGRAAPPSPPESGSRGPAEHEPGRERGGDARPPPPGPEVSDPRRRHLRIPGLRAPSPQRRETAARVGSDLERTPSESGGKPGAPAPAGKSLTRVFWKESNLETLGPPQDSAARSQESPVSLRMARALQDCGSGSFGFASVLNTENPPFASAARILRRRLPVRWRCGACRLGWAPSTPGACCSGAAVEPAPCETVAPDTHPTPARRGLRPVAAPGPRTPKRTRPQMPPRGWWSEPCAPPGMRSVRKPLFAGLAWPPPPQSAAPEKFFLKCPEMN